MIALLWCEQLDYPMIAARLGIRIRTVRMHIEYVARDLPGYGPPAWKVLRHAERLLEDARLPVEGGGACASIPFASRDASSGSP